MHIVNLIIFTSLYPLIFREYLYFDMNAVIYGFVGAVFFTGYHLTLSTAYQYESASTVYPVTTASPFFILIWSVIIFKENLTPSGIIGIVLTVIGAASLNGFDKGFLKLSKGVVFALLAAFCYSLGALVDKVGVQMSNMILYVYSLSVFITLFLFLYSRKNFSQAREKEGRWPVIIAGTIVFISFLSYRYGLTLIELSYASALRQVNAMFGVALGVIVFKEKLRFSKLAGTCIIVAGVILIRLGL